MLSPHVGMGTVLSPHVGMGNLLSKWQTGPFSIAVLVVLVALGAAYLEGVRRLARKGRRWSRWRTASYLLALVNVLLALDSGIAWYSLSVFNMHAIQHTMLMYAAPVLLALSAPMTLWLQASGRRLQQRLLRILHTQVFETLTHPFIVASVSYAYMLGYFLSNFYEFSEDHLVLLDALNVVFAVAGCLYWWPVVGLDPSKWKLSFPAKLGYLATGIPVTTFLGLGLISATRSIDPAIHTLADTHAGGGTLWVLGELFTLGAMGAILVQLMHSEERAAARYDRRLIHEQANSEREAELAREREKIT